MLNLLWGSDKSKPIAIDKMCITLKTWKNRKSNASLMCIPPNKSMPQGKLGTEFCSLVAFPVNKGKNELLKLLKKTELLSQVWWILSNFSLLSISHVLNDGGIILFYDDSFGLHHSRLNELLAWWPWFEVSKALSSQCTMYNELIDLVQLLWSVNLKTMLNPLIYAVILKNHAMTWSFSLYASIYSHILKQIM